MNLANIWVIGQHVRFGNKKLPDTTAIWNCGAATDCPSRPLGLCQAGKHCYAYRVERFRSKPLAFRRRQHEIMRTVDASLIAKGILVRCAAREQEVKLFRFGQSGDFYDQQDVDKMVTICDALVDGGISCYGFTARTDLDLWGLLAVSNVCVSNDTGGWIEEGANRYKVVPRPSGVHHVCPKDCKVCELCSTVRGEVIETERWWKAQMTFNDLTDYCEWWE